MDALERIERAEQELKLAKEQLEEESEGRKILGLLGSCYKVKLIRDNRKGLYGHEVAIEMTLREGSQNTGIIGDFRQIKELGYTLGNVGKTETGIILIFFSGI